MTRYAPTGDKGIENRSVKWKFLYYQAHFVLPETLAQFRRRIDPELMDELLAIQAASAMPEELVSPAHLLVDTFPSEQGSQRVTDATTLYKAQKNSSGSSRRSRAKAHRRPRP